MTISDLILFAYAISWAVGLVSLYVQYLDVQTTMQAVSLGAYETNPDLIPYVKVGDPWLMVRGKLKTAAVMIPLSLIFPPLVFGTLPILLKTWKAVRINQTNIKSLQH